MEKCRFCDNCEIRVKEKESIIIFDTLIPSFGYWKWCRLHNNWCRHIAGNCEIIVKIKSKHYVNIDKYKR